MGAQNCTRQLNIYSLIRNVREIYITKQHQYNSHTTYKESVISIQAKIKITFAKIKILYILLITKKLFIIVIIQMDPTQQSQWTQSNQTFVAGPFWGQIPTPPIADPGINTGTMPPFQFNPSDFWDTEIKQEPPVTNSTTGENEVDPFAWWVQSLNIWNPVMEPTTNSTPTQNNDANTIQNSFDLSNFWEDASATQEGVNTMNFINETETSTTTTTPPDMDFSLPNEEKEVEIPTLSEANTMHSAIEETEEKNKETEEIIATATTQETINTSPMLEETVEEVTPAEETTPSETTMPTNSFEEYQPQSNDLMETYTTFKTSLSELLNLKGSKLVNIVGHRTDVEEVNYEFEQKNETSITATRHHHMVSDNSSTQQTLEFNNTQWLKIMLNTDIIYEAWKEEDQDTVYYLKDKLNKFSTILNEEKVKEEKAIKDAKDAQEKKKRALETLRSF